MNVMWRKIFKFLFLTMRWSLTTSGAAFWLASLLAVGSLIYSYQSASLRIGELKPVSAKTELSKEALAKISDESVDLQMYRNYGRGYRPKGTTLLITNDHVAKCSPLDCGLVIPSVQSVTDEEAKIEGYHAIKCVKWLDICAFSSENTDDLVPTPNLFYKAKPGDELYIVMNRVDQEGLPENSKEALLLKGRVTHDGVVPVSNIPVRPGYSGSVVFNKNGDVVGIIRNSLHQEGFTFSKFIGFHLAHTIAEYLPKSQFIDGQIINDLLLNPKFPEGPDQLNYESEIFARAIDESINTTLDNPSLFVSARIHRSVNDFFTDFWDRLLQNPKLYDLEQYADLRRFDHPYHKLEGQTNTWLKLHALNTLNTHCYNDLLLECSWPVVSYLVKISEALDQGSADELFVLRLADLADNNQKQALLNPRSANDFMRRGRMYDLISDSGRRAEAMSAVIALAPDAAEAYSQRGTMRYFAKDYVGAVHDFTQNLASSNPDDPASSYKLRASSYKRLGYYELCKKDADKGTVGASIHMCEENKNVVPRENAR